MEYRDEASSSSESLHLNENGENGTIEFIKVEHDEETRFVDEIDGSYTLKDENDTIDMLMEAAIAKDKFVLKLVDSIRKLPILWKQNSLGYRDPSAVLDAWNSLSKEFGIPPKYLKEKWILLRAQFATNCAKLKQMRASSDYKYYPTWFAFNAMRFLKETDGKVTEITESTVSAVADDNNCMENESTQVDEVDKQSIILELINQVKQTPALWDQNCPLYNTKTEMAWKNVAERMNLPADDLKLKWNTLRAQFRNNLRKIKSQSSAGQPVRQPTWFAYEAMQFVLKNHNTVGVNLDFSTEVKLPKKVTENTPLLKTVIIKQPVPTAVGVKQHMADPLTVIQPKPVTIKRIVPKAVHHSSMAKPNIRDCKRRNNGSTMSTPPKVLRITSHSSTQSTSKPVHVMKPLSSTSSNIEPFIMKTFQNLTKITDIIAQTENSPYSGLVKHLSAVLSKKRASDFNEIEGLLLKCLNDLQKFPNARNDSVRDTPATNIIDDSDTKNDEREDSNDPYD